MKHRMANVQLRGSPVTRCCLCVVSASCGNGGCIQRPFCPSCQLHSALKHSLAHALGCERQIEAGMLPIRLCQMSSEGRCCFAEEFCSLLVADPPAVGS